MSLGRLSARSLTVILCVALLAALLPAVALAAPGGKAREYIVTLSVADSGRTIAPSSRRAKQRIRQRAVRADGVTDRLSGAHDFKTRHRYGKAITGFSARLTPGQAARVAADPSVASVRRARTFKLANTERIAHGVKRVKAWTTGDEPGPDINAHVAVLDTGIGPASGNGTPIGMDNVAPQNTPELNLAGGINCFDDPGTPTNEAAAYPGRWGDTLGHGTHVAGIIGARDNSVGTIGVAPGVSLWSVRVFEGSRGTEASIVCGLDWAIGTHSDSNPDIDVINMSIEGPRVDYQENCSAIASDPDSDPIQRSICEATAAGITVVAAAGNDGKSANKSSPGGFDQVISVAAMTDTDGAGGGLGGNASCFGYRGQADDTFASYSNYGSEIDVVAPGTCVLSTYPTPSGDAEAVMTGTSMAAPHVAGAAARYLAGHPGTSPSLMRKIVRAAGRMDWVARSDPWWSGPNDSRPPNRVLDVKALVGPEMLKTWLYHTAFKVAGGDTSRTTRVDVQRGGGYAGPVTLSLSGLPGAAGSHAFGDGTLAGYAPSQLGTRLVLNLKRSGQEGRYDLDIAANGPGVSPHSRFLPLTVDRTGPKVTDLAPRLRAGSAGLAASGAGQAVLAWHVDDALSNVKSAQLQRKTGKQGWRNAGTGGSTMSRVTLKPGQSNRFRVKAKDSLGNQRLSKAVKARLSVRDSASSTWRKPAGGGWKTKKVKKAYGGSLLRASGATGSMSTSFGGKAVAVVGSVGPNRGSIRVRIDGGNWTAISMRSGKAAHRRVVWGRRLEPGTHVLEVQGLSGQTTLDAALIVR